MSPEGAVVLVIDDEEDIRGLLRARIERLGHTVIEAATGEAGVELARAHRPDLVVLDILLPDIDGWEVLARMRGDAELGDVAVAVVSIIDEPPRGQRPPVQGFLTKPFRAAEVDDLVQRVLATEHPRRVEADDT